MLERRADVTIPERIQPPIIHLVGAIGKLLIDKAIGALVATISSQLVTDNFDQIQPDGDLLDQIVKLVHQRQRALFDPPLFAGRKTASKQLDLHPLALVQTIRVQRHTQHPIRLDQRVDQVGFAKDRIGLKLPLALDEPDLHIVFAAWN